MLQINKLQNTTGGRWAWLAWAAFALLVVVVKFDVAPSEGNVYNIFREAGLRWRQGLDLYPAELYFNYFPTAALFFVPWTWLPFDVGGAIWRACNIGVFALGLWRISGVTDLPRSIAAPHSVFPIASVFAIALCWSAARYGQMTLMMAGLMMMAATDIQRRALWRAATFSALAVALKPHAVVLLLVLLAIYPGFRWRALTVCAALALLPFLFQDPGYVLDQYTFIPEMLHTRAQRVWPYPHLFGLLNSLGWVSSEIQQALGRLLVALFALFLCWRAQKRHPTPGVAFFQYAVTACYILLMGEGIEHNTYAMMGPVLGLLAADARIGARNIAFAALCTLTAATLLSHTFMRAFPAYPLLAMIKPLVCSVLFVFVASMALQPAPPGNVTGRGVAAHPQSLS